MTLPVFALDFETTGLDPRHDGVLEVGLAGERSYSALVADAPPSAPAARAVHGISPEKARLAGKRGAVVLTELLASLGEGAVRIVAHSAAFERGFLETWAEQAGLDLPEIEWVCTMVEARTLCPDAAVSKSLGNLAARFGWRTGPLHRAQEDAAVTLRLHRFLEAWREIQNNLAGRGRVVYLAGPVRGDGHPRTIQYNQERMFAMAQWVQGVLPHAALVVPHGNFAFLDESGSKGLGVRERILEACSQLVTRCDALVLCGDAISPGMAHERQVAETNDIPVFTSSGWDLPAWHAVPMHAVA